MTKEQIKEALDEVADYCRNHGCLGCALTTREKCLLSCCAPENFDTEKIAEVVADEQMVQCVC